MDSRDGRARRGEGTAPPSAYRYADEMRAELLRSGKEWCLSRPMRLWRLIHLLSCFAAAISRVNVPSALYLFLFVAQVSRAPGGALYRGTNRVDMSRIEVLHAWFTQR